MFIINEECRAGMAKHVADNSIDAIVTDPPYGLSKEPDAAGWGYPGPVRR